MAHFAKLDNNNVVVQVIVIGNDILLNADGVESEELGAQFCEQIAGPGPWLQTSYNHNMRGRFAGPGMIYLPDRDIFIYPCPSRGFVLNENGEWVPPFMPPNDLDWFEWNEERQDWDLIEKHNNSIETGN